MSPFQQFPPKMDFSIPWSTADLWRSANHAMALTVRRRYGRLEEARSLAARIRSRIQALDPLMQGLCERTCSDCTDNCCSRATVWFDFRDLLVLHLAPEALAPGQLIEARYHTCRYLDVDGCALPRSRRPWVCTWFVCAAHKAVLTQWPRSRGRFLFNSLEAVKRGRNVLECIFIQVVTS